MRLATVVDVDALWQTTWTTAVAAIGLCIAFSFAIVGVSRSSEAHRASRHALGLAYAALALVSLAASTTAIVYGVVILTTK